MKSELRTELKSNLLADRLESMILAIKPHLKTIGFVLGTVIVIAILYGVIQNSREKSAAEAWTDFYFSQNRNEILEGVYQDHPTASAGLWARQKIADSLSAQGLSQVYIDRDLSDKLFAEARDHYRAVLERAQEPLLVCRATFGLAQSLESSGKPEEAVREYKKLLTLNGVHAEMVTDAQRRIEFIESAEGSEFFAWFTNNRPVAPKAVDLPKDLENLPSSPNLQFESPTNSNPGQPDTSSSTEAPAPANATGTSEPAPSSEAADKAAPTTSQVPTTPEAPVSNDVSPAKDPAPSNP